MIAGTRLRLVRPSRLTKIAIAASVATIAWSAAFLLVRYPRLPWLLPVHFKPNGVPERLAVQDLLAGADAGVRPACAGADPRRRSARCCCRVRTATTTRTRPTCRAAAAAAEAVALLALIWVAFQGYVAVALDADVAGGACRTGSLVRLPRADRHRPDDRRRHPRPRAARPAGRHDRSFPNTGDSASCTRTRDDPALFVPTRNGARWTLNFGRPVAAALMGVDPRHRHRRAGRHPRLCC